MLDLPVVECESCAGFGHKDAHGNGVDDPHAEKCRSCNGTGHAATPRPWEPGEKENLVEHGLTDVEIEQLIREWCCGLDALLFAAAHYAQGGPYAVPSALRTEAELSIQQLHRKLQDQIAPTGEVEDL
jgi:hypothetical protein